MSAEKSWKTPSKKIFDAPDVSRFKRSLAYQKLHHVLAQVVQKVTGSEIAPGVLNTAIVTRPGGPKAATWLQLPPPSKTVDFHASTAGLLVILERLNTLIDEVPPLEGPRRFGNLACRTWHDRVKEEVTELLSKNLNLDGISNPEGFVEELQSYLLNAFGSQLRLDYGTGHELSFLAFLGGLFDLKVVDLDSVSGPELLQVFACYYDVVRRLIVVYNLEPAGSHGVWGLDDHFHLIYILGAAQFNGSSAVVPLVLLVLATSTIVDYKLSNLYVNAIAFIHRIKTGPFNEHSPIIHDIHTTVTRWEKVLQGVLKMYEVEVLGKFPVVQHFWFGGELYQWKDENGRDLTVHQKEANDEEDDQQTPVTRTGVPMTTAPFTRFRPLEPKMGRR